MPKYNINIPIGKGCFNAVSRKDAVDQALKVYRHLLDKMVESGDIYKVPDVAIEVKPRNAIGELRNEQPIKPSRMGRGGRRMR